MKNKIIILVVTLIFLTSCSHHQRLKTVCNCEQNLKVEAFLKSTIKDSNNMSDEEMEDVIYRLHITAMSIHCDQKMTWVDDGGWIVPEKLKLDSCQTIYQ